MVSIWGERIAALLSVVIAAYMMGVAWDFPAGGNMFPVFACAAIIVTAVLMFIRTIISPELFEVPFAMKPSRETIVPIVATLGTVVYVFAIFWLGYFTSTFLYIIVFSLAVGVRERRTIMLIVLITLPLMYLFFELFLRAQLPKGWLI